MRRRQVEKAVTRALRLANRWDEGVVIIQILPTNRSLLVTHHIGNNWSSMGLNAQESKDRVLESFTCGEKYDLGDHENFENIVDRLIAVIQDNFADII